MMQEIGVAEAKSQLSDILRRVQNGEEFVITKHDEMVAVIKSPAQDYKENAKQVMSELRALLKKAPLGTWEEIKEMRDEGRR